jgi:hypothetical protein
LKTSHFRQLRKQYVTLLPIRPAEATLLGFSVLHGMITVRNQISIPRQFWPMKYTIMKKTIQPIAILSLASLSLAACVQQSGDTSVQRKAPAPVVAAGSTVAGQPEVNVVQFSDLPMPPQARMDTEKSIILGAGDDWTGRVLIHTPNTPESAFDFYRKELPGLGWREITAVRAATSVLTYLREGRVATLQIKSSASGGVDISVTVSPEGKSATNG